MSVELNKEQEYIVEMLSCSWKDVVLQFDNHSVKEIKAELEEMFWSEADTSGAFAQEIFDELNYQRIA